MPMEVVGRWDEPTGWDGRFSEQPQPDDVVFVASQRFRRGDPEATLELRHTEDGRLAVLAFSSLERLVEGCGEAQPWIAFPHEHLDELVRVSGADVVLWDVALAPEQRHSMDRRKYG